MKGQTRGGTIDAFMKGDGAANFDIASGDDVLVRLRVAGLSGQEVVVEVPQIAGSTTIPVTRGVIVAHERAPLDVGDDVIAPDGNGHGVIRAIADGRACVRFAPTIFFTYDVTALKRAKL